MFLFLKFEIISVRKFPSPSSSPGTFPAFQGETTTFADPSRIVETTTFAGLVDETTTAMSSEDMLTKEAVLETLKRKKEELERKDAVYTYINII